MFGVDIIPTTDTDVFVNSYTDMVGDVELSDVNYVLACLYLCCRSAVGTIVKEVEAGTCT